MSADNKPTPEDLEPEQSEPAQVQQRSFRWVVPVILLVVVCGGAIAAGVLAVSSLTGEAVDRADRFLSNRAEEAQQIAEAFTGSKIEQTFAERLTSLTAHRGGRLQVATLEMEESFRREASNWRGTTTSEVRVPAVYHYFVPLDGEWRVEARVGEGIASCFVVAPSLEPVLPVGIRTSELERQSSRGWLRWDKDEEMDALIASITPELEARAANNALLAREQARLAVADFIRTWLLEEEHWRTDRFSAIQVVFANEAADSSRDLQFEPTLIIETKP